MVRSTMNYHLQFRYSVTCFTKDYAVVHCLRALCEWAEKAKYPHKMIGWGHTKKADWQKKNCCITLRFTDRNCRQAFLDKAADLLPDRWNESAQNDNDPAIPTRNR